MARLSGQTKSARLGSRAGPASAATTVPLLFLLVFRPSAKGSPCTGQTHRRRALFSFSCRPACLTFGFGRLSRKKKRKRIRSIKKKRGENNGSHHARRGHGRRCAIRPKPTGTEGKPRTPHRRHPSVAPEPLFSRLFGRFGCSFTFFFSTQHLLGRAREPIRTCAPKQGQTGKRQRQKDAQTGLENSTERARTQRAHIEYNENGEERERELGKKRADRGERKRTAHRQRDGSARGHRRR